MKIGVFDSGVGGLTVAHSILDHFPGNEIFYLGDTSRVPYGNRSPDVILKYAEKALEFLIPKGIETLVIACNTASAVAALELRKKVSIPVLDVIEPVVDSIENTDKNILVIATRSTIQSSQYQKKISDKFPNSTITALETPLFVPLVEEGFVSGKLLENVMDHYFCRLVKKPDCVILGCTHYPFIKSKIFQYFDCKVRIVSSGECLVKSFPIVDKAEKNSSVLNLYFTDKPDHFTRNALKLLKMEPDLIEWVGI